MIARTFTVIFGLFLSFILVEAGLRLAGYASLSLQERRNRVSARQKWTYRILCVGESTTFVGGVCSYPAQLRWILNQRGIGVKFSVINKGVPGINTSGILGDLEFNIEKYAPDMVISMMGINDRGAHMLYEPGSGSRVRDFLGSFRACKLIRLLWLRIIPARSGDPLIDRSLPEQGYVEGQDAPYSKELSKLEQAIQLLPRSEWPYVEIGSLYRVQGKIFEAEALLNTAVELNPENYWAYAELGWIYRDNGRASAAEAMFNKAKELNPKNDWPYLGVEWFLRSRGRSSEAEAVFKKAINDDPGNFRPYVGLGWLYRVQGRFTDAESAFKKAIEIDPGNNSPYLGLGWLYREREWYSAAAALFKKAAEVNPGDDCPYLELGWIYKRLGIYAEAEAAFKKVIELNPQSYWPYRILKVFYMEAGNAALAREYDKKGDELRPGYYPQVVIENYRKLKAILAKKGIVYVCAQYPLRSVDPLKKIFRGEEEGIIFVDNQAVFQEALREKGYDKYFTDMFGGDFGHCTPEGNRLLAENIASVILEKVFSVKRRINKP
ncbi:MAG: tetratricopeptide repeat protein [Candidatus Omnitrophica bacterium]|nr:tetratricopeptide repeat protein [Candidatus Omnitrophota bacterium]